MSKTNEKVHIRNVTDLDGNIIDELYQGDRIVRESQDEYKNKYYINFKRKESFVKMFTKRIVELYKELSTKEYAVMTALMPFISYKDGILRYNNKILDGRELSELLGDKYDTFKRIIASLVNIGILARVDYPSDTYSNKTKKAIVVNPYIFLRGQDIEKDIVDLFVDTKWAD